jgi:hypothetical protein
MMLSLTSSPMKFQPPRPLLSRLDGVSNFQRSTATGLVAGFGNFMQAPNIAIPSQDRSEHRKYVARKRIAFEERYGKPWADFIGTISPQAWPQEVVVDDAWIWCERDFRDFLLMNSQMRHRLGWDSIERATSTVPDFMVRVPGLKTLLLVELEFDAANFVQHGHLPLVHLVLSFKRPDGFESVRGVPVWSMYRYEWGEPDILKWSLPDDIRKNGQSKRKRPSVKCSSCGRGIFSAMVSRHNGPIWCVDNNQQFSCMADASEFIRNSESEFLICESCGGPRWLPRNS